jgi:cell division inhibitor SepF
MRQIPQHISQKGEKKMSGTWKRVADFVFARQVQEPDFVPAPIERVPRRRPIISLHPAKGEEIILKWPRSFDDAEGIADYLKARRAVVMNIRHLDEATARRILDFMSGVIYTIDGQLEEAGSGVYVLSPENVVITADTGTWDTMGQGGSEQPRA